jgi:hypothetical protein
MSFASDSYTLIDLDTAETKVVNDPKNLRESEVGTATKGNEKRKFWPTETWVSWQLGYPEG